MFSPSAGEGEPTGEPTGERLIECWLRALACRTLVMSRPHPMPTNSMVSNSAMSNLKFSKRVAAMRNCARTTIGRTGGARRSPPTARLTQGGSRTSRRVPAACRPCSPRKPMRTLPTRVRCAALPTQWDPVRMIVEEVGQRGEGRGNLKPNQTVGSAPTRRPARQSVPNPMRTVRGPRAVVRPASRQTGSALTWPGRGEERPSRGEIPVSKRSAEPAFGPEEAVPRTPKQATPRPRRAWRPCQANHAREPVPLPWARPSRPVLCGDCTDSTRTQMVGTGDADPRR